MSSEAAAKGAVFNIQRFSLDDGPGIRTTVFLKGCPLRCQWCHNPESFISAPQLSYMKSKCTLCRACESVCAAGVHSFANSQHTVDFKKCVACGKCVQVCPVSALEIIGYTASAEDVIDIVCKDIPYYQESGGGVTFSGGEPTAQFGFLMTLVKMAKERGLHVCLDTTGYVAWEKLKKLLPYVDLILYDYKITDSEEHKKLTGVPNELILDNLAKLSQVGTPVILRCPVIPGINDTDGHFRAAAELKRKYPNIQQVEVMPYHNIGSGKWEKLGLTYSQKDLRSVEDKQKEEWQAKIDGFC